MREIRETAHYQRESSALQWRQIHLVRNIYLGACLCYSSIACSRCEHWARALATLQIDWIRWEAWYLDTIYFELLLSLPLGVPPLPFPYPFLPSTSAYRCLDQM